MARKRRDRDEAPAPESRKQQHLNRRQKEQRRLLLSVTVPLLVLAIGILAVGVWREVVQIPNTPVAEVSGERITASSFTPRINYERRLLLNYVNSIMPLIQSNDPSVINQLVGGQRTGIAQSTQDKLIDEAIIRQEAAARNITVTEADVDQQIYGDLATALAPPATSVPEVTATPTISGSLAVTATLAAAASPSPTPGTGTPGATAAVTPLSTQEIGRQFEQRIQPMLDQLEMSQARYREIVRQQVFRDRLQKALEAEVPAAEKQVELSYLLFSAKETADQAAETLSKGGTWEEVVAEFGPTPSPAPDEAAATPEAAGAETGTASEAGGAGATAGVTETTGAGAATGVTTTSGAGAAGAGSPTPAVPPTPTPEPRALETGGPTWFTRAKLISEWALKEEDADAILALGKGKGSTATQGGRGHYVVWVNDLAESRPVDETDLKTRRDNALTDWLEKKKKELTDGGKINRYPLDAYVPAEPLWFSQAFDELLAAPVPTLPGDSGLVVSTVPAAGGSPDAGGGTPAP